MIKLYQFAISHYCEKIRWALDYKGLDYRTENLLVGRHRETILGLARESGVPVIDHDGTVVQNSSDIISYLDRTFPEPTLTPSCASIAGQAREWEAFYDDIVGVDLRCVWYNQLLDHKEVVVPLFTIDGAAGGEEFYDQVFPDLAKRMRAYMNINGDTAAEAEARLIHAVQKLDDHTKEREFLAGDEFSRADLAAAAILSPLALPEMKYGLSGTDNLPPRLRQLRADLWNKTRWVRELYERFRLPTDGRSSSTGSE